MYMYVHTYVYSYICTSPLTDHSISNTQETVRKIKLLLLVCLHLFETAPHLGNYFKFVGTRKKIMLQKL